MFLNGNNSEVFTKEEYENNKNINALCFFGNTAIAANGRKIAQVVDRLERVNNITVFSYYLVQWYAVSVLYKSINLHSLHVLIPPLNPE